MQERKFQFFHGGNLIWEFLPDQLTQQTPLTWFDTTNPSYVRYLPTLFIFNDRVVPYVGNRNNRVKKFDDFMPLLAYGQVRFDLHDTKGHVFASYYLNADANITLLQRTSVAKEAEAELHKEDDCVKVQAFVQEQMEEHIKKRTDAIRLLTMTSQLNSFRQLVDFELKNIDDKTLLTLAEERRAVADEKRKKKPRTDN